METSETWELISPVGKEGMSDHTYLRVSSCSSPQVKLFKKSDLATNDFFLSPQENSVWKERLKQRRNNHTDCDLT